MSSEVPAIKSPGLGTGPYRHVRLGGEEPPSALTVLTITVPSSSPTLLRLGGSGPGGVGRSAHTHASSWCFYRGCCAAHDNLGSGLVNTAKAGRRPFDFAPVYTRTISQLLIAGAALRVTIFFNIASIVTLDINRRPPRRIGGALRTSQILSLNPQSAFRNLQFCSSAW